MIKKLFICHGTPFYDNERFVQNGKEYSIIWWKVVELLKFLLIIRCKIENQLNIVKEIATI